MDFHGQKRLVDYSPWGCKETQIETNTNTSHFLGDLYGNVTERNTP